MTIEVISNVKEEGRLISRCIEKYGYFPEHNYYYYRMLEESGAENRFIRIDNKYGILGQFYPSQKEWYFITGVIAPEKKRAEILMEVIRYCLNGRGSKIAIDCTGDFWRIMGKRISETRGLRAIRPRFILYWPVFDMKKWDGYSLRGRRWKKLRNTLNRFYKKHNVRVVNSADVPKEKLSKVVDDWVKQRRMMDYGYDRKDSNMEYYERYHNLVNSGFEGMKFAKTLVVDGVPSTITCGWEIPNIEKGYYSGVGIYNYKFEGMGEAANIDDLKRLKRAGYEHVDFGGSPKPLLDFKRKFRYHDVYKTYTFTVLKK
ncbi:DUF2156 domain-containing protein [Candidatus Woesearchaeota archaeon]|nr:DUF2156 domain-containing protein [Candidatus Woesearchaeota archaeon]